MSKRLALAVLVVALGACSSNPNEHKPSPLPALPAKVEQVQLQRLWKVSVGDGIAEDVVKFRIASQNNVYFSASRDGVIVAVNDQGKVIWKQKTKLALTGGVSAGYGMVVVATAKGEVLALNAADGATLWRKALLAPILAPSAITAETVIVQSNDGKVYGLNAKTGDKVWVYDTPVPILSLRGYAAPLIVDDLAMVATASGKVVALDAKTGIGRWELRVATSEGRSELARIIDVDGDMLLSADKQLYVASYQGQLSALDLSGVKPGLRWQLPASSFQALSEGADNVYMVDADSNIVAVNKESGKTVWKQSGFAWRGLSNPVVLGPYVVVGDSEGYLHVMAQADGKLLGRKSVSGAVIGLGVNGQTVLVYSAKGQFSAWQLPVVR